jgi:hypothetical protein
VNSFDAKLAIASRNLLIAGENLMIKGDLVGEAVPIWLRSKC